MLREFGWANNEADSRKSAIGSVLVELVESHKRHSLISKRVALFSLLKLLEPSQGVVVKVVSVLVQLP